MPTEGACPERAALQALLDDALTAGGEATLVAHVEACSHCQQTLDTLAGCDENARLLRAGPSTDRPGGLQQAIRSLKRDAPTLDLPGDPGLQDEWIAAILGPTASPGGLGRLGPYEVTAVLGRGGFGIVFKAFDATLHRFVALKVMAPHLAHSAPARQRFAREARAAAAVRHVHVVAIHGVEQAGALPYLVMEYIAGASLQQRLDRDGALELPEVLRIGVQIAAGLAAAHAQGLVHRDVKPANILLEGNVEQVKITDFGLARAADDASLTQSGVLAGTPHYMAPEQARGDPLDHRADLFSLGSVLYAMCTGRPPFRAETTLALLRRISEEKPRPIRQVNPAVPAWLADVISVLHANDPAERLQSAAEVGALLQGLLVHLQQPGTAPPRLPVPRRKMPRRTLVRGRRWLGIAGAVAAAVLALPAAYLWLGTESGGPKMQTPAPPNGADAMRAAGAAAEADPGAGRQSVIESFDGPFMNAAFNPKGDLLALACQQGKCAQVWDVRAGRLRHVLRGHADEVWAVAFARDAQRLATAAGNWSLPEEPGEVWLWDLGNGRVLRRFAGHTKAALSVAIAPDGRTVASGGLDCLVCLWDSETGARRVTFRGHTGTVRSVAFSPDGTLLASGSFDGTVRLIDVATGAEQACLRTALKCVNRVAFSADGLTLATAELGSAPPAAALPGRFGRPHQGHSHGQVELWDLTRSTVCQVLKGPQGCVLGTAISPDGKMVAAGGGMWGEFGEVSLWDTATGARTVRTVPAWIECVAFAPDGKTLVSAGGAPGPGFSSQLHFWDVAPNPGGPPILRGAESMQKPFTQPGPAAAAP